MPSGEAWIKKSNTFLKEKKYTSVSQMKPWKQRVGMWSEANQSNVGWTTFVTRCSTEESHTSTSRIKQFYQKTIDTLLRKLDTSGGVRVNKLGFQTFTSECVSYYVPHSYVLVPHLSKSLSKLLLFYWWGINRHRKIAMTLIQILYQKFIVLKDGKQGVCYIRVGALEPVLENSSTELQPKPNLIRSKNILNIVTFNLWR